MRILLALILLSFFTSPTYAQEGEKFIFPPKPDYAELTMTGEAQVQDIIDPLRVRLQDGRIIQLSGVEIPDLTPYDTGDIGLTAMAFLKLTLERKTVKIYQIKDAQKGRMNRMGYQLAHLEEKNSGMWIQGAMVINGLARVRPSAVNTELAAPLLTLEVEARDNKRGLWSSPFYSVLTPETAAQGMNGWTIVEGTVRGAAMAGNTVYLNFGQDWHTDFTIGIKADVRRQLTKLNIDPLQFANKHVRVHGWMESYNGPYIELMNAAWIETLPAPAEGTNLNNN